MDCLRALTRKVTPSNLGVPLGCQELNLCQLYVRPMPYYCSDPAINLLKNPLIL